MRPVECLRILGVAASASPREIKRAYRRLALKLHPDRRRGDDDARRRFVQLSKAYQTLMRAARVREQAKERDREVGICRHCGQFAQVFHSPDGVVLCERCILKPRGMLFLPLPAIVVVKCAATIALNALAVGFLIVGWVQQSMWLSGVACGTGLLGLIALAVTCLSIRYCTQPAEMAMYRKLATRRRDHANDRR
jgi:hypothetical protein